VAGIIAGFDEGVLRGKPANEYMLFVIAGLLCWIVSVLIEIQEGLNRKASQENQRD